MTSRRVLSNTRFIIHGTFGVGLMYSYRTLGYHKVMLGTRLHAPVHGYWYHSKEISAIDLSRVRGHIFKLAADGKLVAYKLEEGQGATHDSDNEAFFKECSDYLSSSELRNLLGLQV